MSNVTKVLVANRGEIAVRILRTLKTLDIPGVVVFHQLDADSLAVREADEVIEIFGNTSVGAYLNSDNIIAAGRESGADSVHPGFGFLSENAGFARRLAEEDITFIGPRPEAIEAMGDKITSKLVRQLRAQMGRFPDRISCNQLIPLG